MTFGLDRAERLVHESSVGYDTVRIFGAGEECCIRLELSLDSFASFYKSGRFHLKVGDGHFSQVRELPDFLFGCLVFHHKELEI